MSGEQTGPSLPRALAVLTTVRLVVTTMERFVYPFLPAIARGLGIPLDRAGVLLSVRAGASMMNPALVATIGRDGRRRRQMAVALILVSLGAVIAVGPWGFAGAIVGWALLGLGKPAYDVGAQAWLADRTPYHRRARVLGVFELAFAGGLLVGAPIAGWLIDTWDWRAPFLAIAVLAGVSVPVVRRVTADGHPVGGTPGTRLSLDARDIALLATAALFVLGVELTLVVMGAWLEDAYGLSVLALGGVAILVGGAELVAEVVVLGGADRIGKRATAVAGLLVGGVGFGLVAMAGPSVVVGLAALALALFGFEAAIVAVIPLASEWRPGSRAPFLALLTSGVLGGRAVADLIGPSLYLDNGIEVNALLSAGIFVIAAAALWLIVGDDRTGPPAARVRRPGPSRG